MGHFFNKNNKTDICWHSIIGGLVEPDVVSVNNRQYRETEAFGLCLSVWFILGNIGIADATSIYIYLGTRPVSVQDQVKWWTSLPGLG